MLALKASDWRCEGDSLVVSFDKKPFYDAFSTPQNFKLAAESVSNVANGLQLRLALAGPKAENAASIEDAARKAFGDMLEIVD